jgi:hypothetical protein
MSVRIKINNLFLQVPYSAPIKQTCKVVVVIMIARQTRRTQSSLMVSAGAKHHQIPLRMLFS